jgi:tetratricopeptide (TPR) repeat protein
MNMMRTDFGELQLDAKLIDSSKVIEGYIYLSDEIAQEKKLQKRNNQRTNSLFVILLMSIALYVWDNGLLTQSGPSNLESFHPAPALGDLLSDGVVEQLQPETAGSVRDSHLELDVGVPEDIVKFIDADISADKKIEGKSGIALVEIKTAADNIVDVQKILNSGNQLFKRDRLMSPPEHNAFARYEKVLSIQPDNTEALNGIKNIVNRYVSLADMVIAKNEEYKVPELIKKAYQAGEKYVDVSALIQRFSKYLSDDSVLFDAGSELDVAIDQEDGISVSENEVTHHELISSADSRIAETAYRLYVDGDTTSAEKVLKNFTQLSGFWGASNDLLLKMYLAENEIAKAENLIYESKALDAYQFAEKAARVMMRRGDSDGALRMMSAYRPEFLENKNYYVLLASLYNKVGDFQRSVYWYRQLLSLDHKDARLWLGLAVSLDALNHDSDALQAFDYVRLYAQNQSAVKNYINERQLALVN